MLVLVAVFLRSPRYALLALVPTLLPVIVTLGAMGLVAASLFVEQHQSIHSDRDRTRSSGLPPTR